MNSIEFDEEHKLSTKDLAAALFFDSSDPRSVTYKRIHHRPQIHWGRIALAIIIPATAIVGIYLLLTNFHVPTLYSIPILIVISLVYMRIILKPTIICLVRLYQHFAPDYIRDKCRFEPSCSEYMILSIQKYGIFRGVSAGVKRLKRCNVSGGGVDFP